MTQPPSPDEIRNARLEHSDKRPRDLADHLGISEAEFLAAHVGTTGGLHVTRIEHAPDTVMPLMTALGEVMALTRNSSCVHERVGTFEDYRSGTHAAMVLGKEIDTRIFPKHWAFGFAVEIETNAGLRRSLQFFDTAGDAVQKVHLRDGSNLAAWEPLIDRLRLSEQSQEIMVESRPPVEAPKASTDKRDALVTEWQRMTDTHQFNRLTAKLGMNRLGAYRLAGAPFVRRVPPEAVTEFFTATSEAKQKVVLFVGNRGNIQIHWGGLETIKPMGPWLNVLDDRFNLHLRSDHIAEVYVVDKPTKRGPAMSIEAFDAKGTLIFQCFGQREDDTDDLAQWHGILTDLPALQEAAE